MCSLRRSLGLLVSPDDNPQYLVIDDVRGPSLVTEWNSSVTHHEALQVHPGDQILAVNGVSGNWEEMLNVIQVKAAKLGDVLRLTVILLLPTARCTVPPLHVFAMSFRFLNWFEGSAGESQEEANNGGYVATVKNTFIHFGELEQQPDYRPARSGPAKVETVAEHFSGTLPRLQEEGGISETLGSPNHLELPGEEGNEGLSTFDDPKGICVEEEASMGQPVFSRFCFSDSLYAREDPTYGPGTPATTSMASACFEALTPVEAPIKNTFIHFDEQQPDYTSTVSGPAVLRSVPQNKGVTSTNE
eukprot:symbB.v1.2.032291.t1/scaffold3859.1/size49193/1